MNPDAERFISLATAPLAANAELQLSAKTELRAAIATAGGGLPSLRQAGDSLERADRHPHRGRWRIALAAVALLISLPMLGVTVWQLRQLRQLPQLLWPLTFSGELGLSSERDFPHLDARQRLLMFGASGAPDDAEKWKPLWESEPENAAYLATYALAYFKEHDELAPEILAAAERIDPDNGWFLTLKAAGLVEGAVTKERRPSSKSKTSQPAPVWKINDEKRLEEILETIHQIVEKPSFTSYQAELAKQRGRLLPPLRDYASHVPRLFYMASQPATSIHQRKLADALAAGAQQAAAKGDVAAFRQIISDWQSLTSGIIGSTTTLVDGLVAKVFIGIPLKNFRDAARALSLENEAAYFAEFQDRIDADRLERDRFNKVGKPGDDLIMRKSSLLLGITSPMIHRLVKSSPALAEAELRPGRYADHALLERVLSWLAWAVLGAAAALAVLSRFIRSPLARKLSGRFEHLFRPVDWAWVVSGGIVFPVAWYFLITRLSPWAAREWSALLSMFISPGGQFGCLALSMIILTAVIASGRLAKRGAALGLKPRCPWIGWVAALAALAGVPAFGAMMAPGNVVLQKVAFGLAGFAGLWLFVGLALNCFGHASQALRRATLARIVWPVWVAGMLVLVGLVPYFHAEEIRWLRQDRMTELSAEAGGWTYHEHRVARMLRAELLETIAAAGPIPGSGEK